MARKSSSSGSSSSTSSPVPSGPKVNRNRLIPGLRVRYDGWTEERTQRFFDALARAGEGLVAVAYKRAVEGKETIIIRGGQEVERRITPSDAILGLLLKRGDMTGNGLIGGKTPDDYLSFDEWQQDKKVR